MIRLAEPVSQDGKGPVRALSAPDAIKNLTQGEGTP